MASTSEIRRATCLASSPLGRASRRPRRVGTPPSGGSPPLRHASSALGHDSSLLGSASLARDSESFVFSPIRTPLDRASFPSSPVSIAPGQEDRARRSEGFALPPEALRVLAESGAMISLLQRRSSEGRVVTSGPRRVLSESRPRSSKLPGEPSDFRPMPSVLRRMISALRRKPSSHHPMTSPLGAMISGHESLLSTMITKLHTLNASQGSPGARCADRSVAGRAPSERSGSPRWPLDVTNQGVGPVDVRERARLRGRSSGHNWLDASSPTRALAGVT